MELRGHSTADDHTFQHAPPEGPPWSRHSPWYWPNCVRRPTLRTHLRGRDEPGAHQNLFRRAARRSIRPTYLFSPGPPQKSKAGVSPLLQVGSRAGRLAAGRLAAACSLANSPQRARCFSRSLSAGRFFFRPCFSASELNEHAGWLGHVVAILKRPGSSSKSSPSRRDNRFTVFTSKKRHFLTRLYVVFDGIN